MTTQAEHTRRNQLLIRKSELEDLLQERDAETAEKILAPNAKIAKLGIQLDELLEKGKALEAIIEQHQQNEVYRDAGMRYLIDLKTELRSLSIQCGEVETQEEDQFLSQQLSFCGPDEIDYLKGLKRRLKERRHGMFLLGSIDPDAPEGSEENKKRQYETGRQIGKVGVIPIH